MKKDNLFYYVYREDFNRRKIERYNVLNTGILKEIRSRTSNISNKNQFAEEIDRILRYYYWAKSEHEITLADWPARIKPEELTRLNKELEEYQQNYGRAPYSLVVNLSVEEKIDIYGQVKLNWDIFIDYVWNNLKGV